MLVELRSKSQITIPKELVNSLSLSEGDKLEIFEENGTIRLVPSVVYPKQYVDALQQEIAQIKTSVQNGSQPVFTNIDELFTQLENC